MKKSAESLNYTIIVSTSNLYANWKNSISKNLTAAATIQKPTGKIKQQIVLKITMILITQTIL